MKWLELKIDAAPAGLDPVSALLEDLGITGLVIDDEGDFRDFLEHNRAYWDYVDDALMQEKKGLCRITFYLEDSPDGYNTLSRVRMALSRVKQEHPEYGSLLLTMENMEDADWENNWKQFYKPMEIGDRLIVIPEWESAGVPEGRVALRLNPGLTFGTGSHATTRLCLTALEKHVRAGKRCWTWAAAAAFCPLPPCCWERTGPWPATLTRSAWTWPMKMPPSTGGAATATPAAGATW